MNYLINWLQNFKEKDGGKIVLYTTSMGIVRSTYAKCQAVKQILRTLMVKFEERDVFMSFNHQQEIRDRMQNDDIDVPQLFVDGQYIGVSDIESLHSLDAYRNQFVCVRAKTMASAKISHSPLFQPFATN